MEHIEEIEILSFWLSGAEYQIHLKHIKHFTEVKTLKQLFGPVSLASRSCESLKFTLVWFGFISGVRETITIITFVIEYMIRIWHVVEMKCLLCVYKY